MATQEDEIANYMQRLAGTGTTVGMAEQDIVALGASMSSVGISAEAGKNNCLTMEKSIV